MKISIVTPAHNEELHLAACIESVCESAKQYHQENECLIEYEHLIVLNRCTDSTEAIASSYGCKIVREDERNLARIRNAGVHAATGEIIATIDADSVMSPNMLSEIVNKIESGKYIGGGVMIYPERYSLGIICSAMVLLPYAIWSRISAGLFWCLKKDFVAICGFDESFICVEDLDFGERLKAYGKTKGKRYGTLFRAYITTSCRKFDQFGDWHFVTNPKLVRDLFRRKQQAADSYYYDARSAAKHDSTADS